MAVVADPTAPACRWWKVGRHGPGQFAQAHARPTSRKVGDVRGLPFLPRRQNVNGLSSFTAEARRPRSRAHGGRPYNQSAATLNLPARLRPGRLWPTCTRSNRLETSTSCATRRRRSAITTSAARLDETALNFMAALRSQLGRPTPQIAENRFLSPSHEALLLPYEEGTDPRRFDLRATGTTARLIWCGSATGTRPARRRAIVEFLARRAQFHWASRRGPNSLER